MKDFYFDAVVMIERLHRLFLEAIRIELDRLNMRDINNVQALILYNIGENQLTVGELTNRGYYLGSNVSYNLRKMVQNDYVVQFPSLHDRRSSHVQISDKGMELYKQLDTIFHAQAKKLADEASDPDMMKNLCKTLKKLEGFWSGFLSR